MPDGLPQKKGSTIPIRVESSQPLIRTRARATRSTWTCRLRRRRRATALGSGVADTFPAGGTGSASALSSLIADQHLLPEVAPDLLVDVRETAGEAGLLYPSRARPLRPVDAPFSPLARGG